MKRRRRRLQGPAHLSRPWNRRPGLIPPPLSIPAQPIREGAARSRVRLQTAGDALNTPFNTPTTAIEHASRRKCCAAAGRWPCYSLTRYPDWRVCPSPPRWSGRGMQATQPVRSPRCAPSVSVAMLREMSRDVNVFGMVNARPVRAMPMNRCMRWSMPWLVMTEIVEDD